MHGWMLEVHINLGCQSLIWQAANCDEMAIEKQNRCNKEWVLWPILITLILSALLYQYSIVVAIDIFLYNNKKKKKKNKNKFTGNMTLT
jgi:hypothetical protein